MKIGLAIAVCITLAACSSEPRLPAEAPLPLQTLRKTYRRFEALRTSFT